MGGTMSALGLIMARGTPCTIKRATETKATDRSTVRTWATVAVSQKLLVQELTYSQAQEIWGVDTIARFRVMVDPSSDIQLADGILPESGDLEGEHFCVEERSLTTMMDRHRVLGLAKTVENFG
jgi:hypothetical protein